VNQALLFAVLAYFEQAVSALQASSVFELSERAGGVSGEAEGTGVRTASQGVI